MLDAATFLEHLGADGDRLAAVAPAAPEATIESCPGWDMTDLLAHVGGVHRWVDHIVAIRADSYHQRHSHPPEGFDAVFAWYQEGRDQLRATLAATDPEVAVWNWAQPAPAPARFWFRRMAHETAIHRWDAEAAAGDPHPLDAALAVDGIDEYLGFVAVWLGRQSVEGLQGSLHLHATDTAIAGEGEWSMELTPGHMELRRAHAKSDTALRGPVSDLWLWLLNRVPADSGRFQVFGDTALLDRWRELKF